MPVPVSAASVARSPSAIVAVTMPDVAAARALACEVVAVPLSTLMASLPKPVMPSELTASMSSAAVPVSVVMEEASMDPVVSPSRVLRTAAASVVSERVTF